MSRNLCTNTVAAKNSPAAIEQSKTSEGLWAALLQGSTLTMVEQAGKPVVRAALVN